MFNFKVSGIAGGAAFVLSLFLGLLGGVSPAVFLLRASIFGVFFFILVCVIFWLAGRFVPELFSVTGGPDAGPENPGSRVDISVGSGQIEGTFLPDIPADGVDDIENPVSGASPDSRAVSGDSAVPAGEGLDQDEENEYTAKGVVGGKAPAAFRPSTAGPSGEIDLMPDFDALSAAFLPNSGGEGDENSSFDAGMAGESGSPGVDIPVFDEAGFDSPAPRKPLSTSKKNALKGDFNPKELAQAIQTVLKKEEKG